MAIYYIDTSALVKRYRSEQGTEVIDKLFDDSLPEDRYFTSFLTILGFTSSIIRLERSSQIKVKTAKEMLARFRSDLREIFHIWPLDNEIINSSVAIVEKYGLRSADAIHLATALAIFSFISGPAAVMVSSDRELLEAAIASGVIALDPQIPSSMDMLKSRFGEN